MYLIKKQSKIIKNQSEQISKKDAIIDILKRQLNDSKIKIRDLTNSMKPLEKIEPGKSPEKKRRLNNALAKDD